MSRIVTQGADHWQPHHRTDASRNRAYRYERTPDESGLPGFVLKVSVAVMWTAVFVWWLA